MKPKRNKAILFNEVKIADNWFPPETAFFVVGSPRWLGLSKERKCYEINTSWLVRAISGRDMAERRRLTREELLVENIKEVLKAMGGGKSKSENLLEKVVKKVVEEALEEEEESSRPSPRRRRPRETRPSISSPPERGR